MIIDNARILIPATDKISILKIKQIKKSIHFFFYQFLNIKLSAVLT
jgi:hypothetical protein